MAWAAVVWTFSTSAFSEDHTSRFLLPALQWLFPHAAPETLEVMHTGVRKVGHFVEYFILSLLLFRAIRGERAGWNPRWALAALAFAAAYALVDEGHQIFAAGRGASLWDVLLDATGAAMAQFVVWWRLGRSVQRESLGTDVPR